MQGTNNRAAMQLTDVLLSGMVLIAIIALAPIWYQFIDMLRLAEGVTPFTKLVLALVLPSLLLGLLLSAGISARRGT